MAANESDQKPGSKTTNGEMSRKEAIEMTEQVAKESEVVTSSGNREALPDSKPGSAQRGGPDIDKARRRQPPDAERPTEDK